MMITGFILSILGMVGVLGGFVMPRYYDALIPVERRGEGMQKTVIDRPIEQVDGVEFVHSGSDDGESGRQKSEDGFEGGDGSRTGRAERE
jgi:solute carrier family 6 GABA transporter-like protein 1